MADFIETARRHCVTVGSGSGVLIQPSDGEYCYVITAKHVIEITENANTLLRPDSIDVADFEKHPIEIVAVNLDDTSDLAVLITKEKHNIFLQPSISKITRDETVYFYGFAETRRASNPDDYLREFEGMVKENDSNKFGVKLDDKPSWDEVLGSSGGGIFTSNGYDIFLAGIETRMEGNTTNEHHGKVVCIPLSVIEEFLKRKNLPSIYIESTPRIDLRKNGEWLNRIFSDKRCAKQMFGQSIAPLAASKVKLQSRAKLVSELTEKAFLKVNSSTCIIIGDEGCGKSWLFAQTWSVLENRPLTIIISSSEIDDSFSYSKIENFIIEKIIIQTDRSATDSLVSSWENRFEYWKTIDSYKKSPRLVVFIDGLNQHARSDWGRIIDSFNKVLGDLGGNCILSSRQGHFNSNIKDTLQADFNLIRVAEWHQEELKKILSECAIDIDDVSESVATTLRNPRILSIALELVDSATIINFSELNVERLLFEHIRASAKDSLGVENPEQFKNRLSKHAQEIIDRVKKDQKEDRFIFEVGDVGTSSYNLSTDLLAVTEGHFFHPLKDDPNLYTLSKEGLSVALGIALIKSLQKSERNQKSLTEALSQIIEPISALDMTSKALISALLVSSIDDKCSDSINETVVLSFLKQQNIDGQEYPIFSSAVRSRPSPALKALHQLACVSEYVAGKDWLIAALRNLRFHKDPWKIALSYFEAWLRIYSLSPELSVYISRSGDDDGEYEVKVSERRVVLSQKMSSLSSAERKFNSVKMSRSDDVNTSELSGDIFKILAGSGISSLSEALVAWAISQSLNSSSIAAHSRFQSLIRFNSQDWGNTRANLLNIAKIFDEGHSSITGRWAMVALLRGTATLEDADKESLIYEELTKDQKKYGGWRLVEKYCASDPCDPSSIIPDNIADAAKQLRDIKIEDSRTPRSMTSDDIFVRHALPGLARFLPDVAIEYCRKIAIKMTVHDIQSMRMSLIDLAHNSPLLTSGIVESLIKNATSTRVSTPWSSTESKDSWFVVQYSLFLAFPHIGGSRQLDILSSLSEHKAIMLNLTGTFKPATPDELENALQQAYLNGNDNTKISVLAFARYSRTPVSESSKRVIGTLFKDAKSPVRAQALNTIAYLQDATLIEAVANSGWSTKSLGLREQCFEVHYGSLVLVAAGKLGILSVEDVAARIDPTLYGRLAQSLGGEVKTLIKELICESLDKMMRATIICNSPTVEQNYNSLNTDHPRLLSLIDNDDELSAEESMQRSSESQEKFDERQERSWDSFKRFEKEISEEGARLIVDDVGLEAIKVLTENSPETAVAYANEFLRLPKDTRARVTNIAFMLARCLSDVDAHLAERLFDKFQHEEPVLRITHGLAYIPLCSWSIWHSADNEVIDTLRARRLDSAANDYELSVEVLTALYSDKADFLKRYTEKLLDRERPIDKARALMILGFGDQSDETESILAQYSGSKGFIGSAVDAANNAYKRNVWSRHWYNLMCDTDSPEEFWSYGVLLTKIIDGRFELWANKFEKKGDPIVSFFSCFESKLKNRIGRWKGKREKTLCGSKVPETVFLISK